MKFFLSLLFMSVLSEGAKVYTYLDAHCSNPITTFVAFTDVCTWGTDKYNGAFSISLSECAENFVEVNIFNATLAPTCQEASPLLSFSANSSCSAVQDFYVRAENTTCVSENAVYNVLAHFTENCTDGGLAFSIDTLNTPCEENSFAPYLLSYDTSTNYMNPFYTLALYESSNGTCQNELTMFKTESFPAQCLKPTVPYHQLAIDIYNAFPL